MPRIVAALVLLAPAAAGAQPAVMGSTAELGMWMNGAGVAMADDGLTPDAVAGDGVWTADVAFAAAGLVEYKISRNGVDLMDGGVGAVGSNNMRINLPMADTVTFYYDTRDRSMAGWFPAMESLSDSYTGGLAGGGVWLAIGDFQTDLGDSAFNQDSVFTQVRDDGQAGDVTAGDGVYSYRFAAIGGNSGAYKFAIKGMVFTTKLGIDGYSFDGFTPDSMNDSLNTAAADITTLELDALHGRVRQVPGGAAATPGKLHLSEMVGNPTTAEYAEIYNPGGQAIVLSDVYLTDRNTYYTIPAGPLGGFASDFVVRFPAGAVIEAGEYQTVAIDGANSFLTEHGVDATYEIPDVANSLDTIPDQGEVWAGSIGGSRSLTNGGEPLILWYWDGQTDLVTDLDMMVFGAPTNTGNMGPERIGVTVDGPDPDMVASAYNDDTLRINQVPIDPPGAENGVCRLAFVEGQGAMGNGVGGEDETSEDWSATWVRCPTPTPNAPTVHSIAINPTPAVVFLNGTVDFDAVGFGDQAQTQAVPGVMAMWSSTPATPTYFTLDAMTGDVTGDAIGQMESITADAGGSLTDTVPVTVTYKDVNVTCAATLLRPSDTTQCSVQVFDGLDQQVMGLSFMWSVTGTSASVDGTGLVTADAMITGTTQVSVQPTDDPNASDTIDIDVEAPALDRIDLALLTACPAADCAQIAAGAEYTVIPGTALSFMAEGFDQFGDPIALMGETWSSSNMTAAPDPVAGMVTTLMADGETTDFMVSVMGTDSNPLRINLEDPAAATITVTGLPFMNNVAASTTAQLGADVLDQYGQPMMGQTIDWSSDNTPVAAVDSMGLVTATAMLGMAEIRAEVQGTGVEDRVDLNIVDPTPVPTYVEVTPVDPSLFVNGTQQLTATLRDQFGMPIMAAPAATWMSSDDLVATVDGAGIVTAVAPGTATITGTIMGIDGTTDAAVTYKAIDITCDQMAIPVSGTASCTASALDDADMAVSGVTFTWSIQSGTSATVDNMGAVTADTSNTGTTVIAAVADDDPLTVGTFSIDVEIPALANMALGLASACPSADCIEITAGAEYTVAALSTQTFTLVGVDQFGATVDVSTATWASSNLLVAPDPMGAMTTLLDIDGDFTDIDATLGSVTSNAVRLNAEQRAAAAIAITGRPMNDEVMLGGMVQLGATVTDQFGATLTGATIDWMSSDTSLLTVDSTGQVTAQNQNGMATITASVAGTMLTDTVTLTVTGTPGFNITGNVSGPSGPIDGAAIAVGTMYNATTDGAGDYGIMAVTGGTYIIMASAPGFVTGTQQIIVDRDLVVDFALLAEPAAKIPGAPGGGCDCRSTRGSVPTLGLLLLVGLLRRRRKT